MAHHEHWDGNGYRGLSGHAISEAARIVAIIDVFDALTTNTCTARPCRKKRPWHSSRNVQGASLIRSCWPSSSGNLAKSAACPEKPGRNAGDNSGALNPCPLWSGEQPPELAIPVTGGNDDD